MDQALKVKFVLWMTSQYQEPITNALRMMQKTSSRSMDSRLFPSPLEALGVFRPSV
jgi:hypothetical protein